MNTNFKNLNHTTSSTFSEDDKFWHLCFRRRHFMKYWHFLRFVRVFINFRLIFFSMSPHTASRKTPSKFNWSTNINLHKVRSIEPNRTEASLTRRRPYDVLWIIEPAIFPFSFFLLSFLTWFFLGCMRSVVCRLCVSKRQVIDWAKKPFILRFDWCYCHYHHYSAIVGLRNMSKYTSGSFIVYRISRGNKLCARWSYYCCCCCVLFLLVYMAMVFVRKHPKFHFLTFSAFWLKAKYSKYLFRRIHFWMA